MAGGYFYVQSKKPQTEYTTVGASKGNIIQTVSVTGELVSENQVDLAFKTGGRLRTLAVEVGEEVSAGQLLGGLEPGALNAELKQAQEQVQYQKELLANMKERDETYNSEQKDAQRAQIRAAEEAVSAILAHFGDLRLFSPIDGVVLKRNADPGEIVTSVSPVLTVGNPKNLIIESNIPESDIVKISVGQKAAVSFDALLEEQIFEAEVVSIEPASTVIQDVVYYKIKLKFGVTEEKLKTGMSADIDVKTAERANVLMIPLRAVKTEDGKKFVDIMLDAEKNSTEKKFIEVGLEGDAGLVEVVSGLNEGEKVITFVKTQ